MNSPEMIPLSDLLATLNAANAARIEAMVACVAHPVPAIIEDMTDEWREADERLFDAYRAAEDAYAIAKIALEKFAIAKIALEKFEAHYSLGSQP